LVAVHPLSTALFLLGYGLAVPVLFRMSTVVARRNRLALWGHQIGVLIATAGWLTRGRVFIVFIHLGWMAAANLWFEFGPTLVQRLRGQNS
jgi:hypothetical protein